MVPRIPDPVVVLDDDVTRMVLAERIGAEEVDCGAVVDDDKSRFKIVAGSPTVTSAVTSSVGWVVTGEGKAVITVGELVWAEKPVKMFVCSVQSCCQRIVNVSADCAIFRDTCQKKKRQ